MEIEHIHTEKEKIIKRMIHLNYCQGCTMLCKTDFIKKNLPIHSDFLYHDWYFGLLGALNNALIYDPVCTMKYRRHDKNVTSNEISSFIKKLATTKYSFVNDNNEMRIKVCNYVAGLQDISWSIKV